MSGIPNEVPERLVAALADKYAIEEPLGAGGMATVYLARDIKHDRKVAIKVLRPELAAVIGGERFVAEIRTTAALQHPHILPLFDSGEADTFLYYVMPFVEGESLRDRLDREGQLPVEEAVRIARAVGAALHYAHERDIVHRDIKPANILMHAGEPVVADFGIAIAISAAGGGRLTETGMSVGTPHYMSPEQASADRDIDARSDTYALACVLYEMLAGQPPHTGPNAQAVLMRILTENPRSITDVRRSVPAHVRDALSKGLEKLAADRFGSAKEFADALADQAFSYHPVVVDATVQALPAIRRQAGASGGWKRFILPAAAAVIGLAAGSVAFGGGTESISQPATSLVFELGELTFEPPQRMHVSPDGRYYAFVGDDDALDGIFIRGANELNFRHLPGTEDAGFMAFSPDGNSIAFDDLGCGIRVIPSGGGSTRQVLPGLEEGCRIFLNWQDEEILFVEVGAHPGRVSRVPASGGAAEVLFEGTAAILSDPFMLSDGRAVLFSDSDAGDVQVYDLDADSTWTLLPNARWARVVAGDRLVYVDGGGGVWGANFDVRKRAVQGDPIPIMGGVVISAGLAPALTIADNGTLVYLRGESTAGVGFDSRLRIVDFDTGGEVDVPIQSRRFRNVRWSPDGSTLAFAALEPAELSGRSSIYTYNVDLRTATQRLTGEGTQAFPVWSPDGESLAYLDAQSLSGPNNTGMGPTIFGDIWTVGADGNGAQKLLERDGQDVPYAWDSQGSVLFTGGIDTGSSDLLRASTTDLGTESTYLDIDGDIGSAAISPDGRYAAFLSSEEVGVGQEIEVRSYPEPGPPIVVSQGGGNRPRWSGDGTRLFYWKTGQVDTLMMARVRTTPTFEVLSQEVVLTGLYQEGTWDLHPDGDRMVIAVPENMVDDEDDGEEPEPPVFTAILNWFTDLDALLGSGN